MWYGIEYNLWGLNASYSHLPSYWCFHKYYIIRQGTTFILSHYKISKWVDWLYVMPWTTLWSGLKNNSLVYNFFQNWWDIQDYLKLFLWNHDIFGKLSIKLDAKIKKEWWFAGYWSKTDLHTQVCRVVNMLLSTVNTPWHIHPPIHFTCLQIKWFFFFFAISWKILLFLYLSINFDTTFTISCKYIQIISIVKNMTWKKYCLVMCC